MRSLTMFDRFTAMNNLFLDNIDDDYTEFHSLLVGMINEAIRVRSCDVHDIRTAFSCWIVTNDHDDNFYSLMVSAINYVKGNINAKG